MNKKFVWKFKHTIYFCLFNVLMLVVALFLNNDGLIRYLISASVCSIGVVIGHIIRMKAGIKDNEILLSKKQMLFVFSLSGLVILSMFFIKQFIADKSLAIIIICALALISGIYALIYVMKAIKQNKK
ncbi:MAG: hypothetical protein LBC68_11635 [Prevotellaceae bacterium]|nr:hypothetical protein [Prevotellaceae bacterium]